MERGSVIELVGLPGAGKSTVLEAVSERLGGAPLAPAIERRSTRLLTKAQASLRYRRAVTAFVSGLSRDSRSLRHKALAVRWFAATLEAHEAARNNGAVVVLGEGVAQRAVLGFVDLDGRSDRRRLGRYLEAVPRPDVLVFLDLPAPEAAARMSRRRLSELDLKRDHRMDSPELWSEPDGTQLQRFLLSASDVILRAVASLERSGTRVVKVDGTSSAAVEQAVALLTELVSDGPRSERPRAEDAG